MIITRTPLRVSFAGGGTDLPMFYREEPGAVVSTTINRYVYILLHPFFTDHIQLKYSKTETVDHVSEIQMPVFREALKMFEVEKKLEVGVIADLPKDGGSGLGGSTAFSVGLINALSNYRGKPLSKIEYAKKSTELEIDILGNSIGKQDQFASAIGGLNFIQFYPDDSVSIDPIYLKPEIKKSLQKKLLLFYTGKVRQAENLLKSQQEQLKNSQVYGLQREIRDLAYQLNESLRKNQIENFGRILHENWKIKRELTNGITSSDIDDWYNKGIHAGAIGGKLLGAGGGGFLLFYCNEENQADLRKSLKDLEEHSFVFENEGTKVILID